MKLEKAVEILTKLERTLAPTMSVNGTDAITLGIEAVKFVQNDRLTYPYVKKPLLSGETED